MLAVAGREDDAPPTPLRKGQRREVVVDVALVSLELILTVLF